MSINQIRYIIIHFYLSLWTVKGKVTSISKVSNYLNKQKKEHRRFSFDIDDGDAEIRVVCFLSTEKFQEIKDSIVLDKVILL